MFQFSLKTFSNRRQTEESFQTPKFSLLLIFLKCGSGHSLFNMGEEANKYDRSMTNIIYLYPEQP